MPYESSENTFERPMGYEIAKSLTNQLLCCYPSPNLHDAEGWIATLIELLAQYSWLVAEPVIVRISRTSRFIPSIAEIAQPLDEALKAARREYWDKHDQEQRAAREAQRMLEAIVNPEPPPPPEPPKPPRPTLEELHAKYGPTWGIDQHDGGKRYATFARMTKEQALARLRAEFGDLVDQVPDAPPRDGWRTLR